MATQTIEVRVLRGTSAKDYGVYLPAQYNSVTVRGPKDSMTQENITRIVAAWSNWQRAVKLALDRWPKAKSEFDAQALESSDSDSKETEDPHPNVQAYETACTDRERFSAAYLKAVKELGLQIEPP